MANVIGSRRKPASVADMPATSCERSGTNTDSAMKLKKQMNTTAQQATTTLFLNSANDTIGSGCRRSWAMKAASNITPAIQQPRLSPSLQATP